MDLKNILGDECLNRTDERIDGPGYKLGSVELCLYCNHDNYHNPNPQPCDDCAREVRCRRILKKLYHSVKELTGVELQVDHRWCCNHFLTRSGRLRCGWPRSKKAVRAIGMTWKSFLINKIGSKNESARLHVC